jgi:hypothetical protein
MDEADESMQVAAKVPEDLPEEEPPPPEIPAPAPSEAPPQPPPPDAWHAVAHDFRPGEVASRESAVGLLYRQRRRI